MKRVFPLVLVSSVCLLGQGAPAPSAPKAGTAPDTKVAEVNGRVLTAGEVDRMISGMPPNLQAQAGADKRKTIEYLLLMELLTQQAETKKLDQQSPYKERLDFYRRDILTQARLQDVQDETVVLAEDQRKHYEANRDRYTQVKFKAIYLPFSTLPAGDAKPGERPMTEAEAKTKATELAQQARGGAEFAALAKEHSQDANSKARGGDFDPLRKSEAGNLPEGMRQALFTLSAGQVSDPVRAPNGYYVFKVTESGVLPFDTVRDETYKEIKQQAFTRFLDESRKQVSVKVLDQGYFTPQPALPSGMKMTTEVVQPQAGTGPK